jgi:hypothetical protein
MDEVSSFVRLDLSSSQSLSHLVFESHNGRAFAADEEKHEPASDIDTAVVDSPKTLDPRRPKRSGHSENESPIAPPGIEGALLCCAACRNSCNTGVTL